MPDGQHRHATTAWLLDQQVTQFEHDQRNHHDIACLHRADRLKHYGLHYAKYCGRLARDDFDDAQGRTLTDWFLVALSASIALQDRLDDIAVPEQTEQDFAQCFSLICDATGRFCDACEKIDHLEEFRTTAVRANRDLVSLLLSIRPPAGRPLSALLSVRRQQLSDRAFYSR